MTLHWSTQYQGARWARDANCFDWFRRIIREQFGREIPDAKLNRDCLALSAARLMSGNILDLFGYEPTEHPVEGDGVFLTKGGVSHHLGMAIYPGGKFRVLHVLDEAGLVVSSRVDLAVNGWTINGYVTHARTARP